MSDLLFYRFYTGSEIHDVEECYYISACEELTEDDINTIESLVSGTIYNVSLQVDVDVDVNDRIVEKGPKLRFQSTWGTNAKSILHKCGIAKIDRIEKFIRGPYRIVTNDYDKMVEDIYETPLTGFVSSSVDSFPLSYEKVECSLAALRKYNEQQILGFDDEDLVYYHKMWATQNRVYITELELHDLAQSNSEHSRHHVFRGEMHLETENGVKRYGRSLMDLVKRPLKKLKEFRRGDNSVIAFSDNSSAIKGSSHPFRTIS